MSDRRWNSFVVSFPTTAVHAVKVFAILRSDEHALRGMHTLCVNLPHTFIFHKAMVVTKVFMKETELLILIFLRRTRFAAFT